jgi:hypothetical protein
LVQRDAIQHDLPLTYLKERWIISKYNSYS